MRYLGILFLYLLSYSAIAVADTHNIYNSQGYLVAECQLETEQGCHYLLYEGLSNTAKVGGKKYQRYLHGPTGKIAVSESTTESELSFLVPDFHQSISVMVQQDVTQSLLDAFGNPLTTESNPIPAIYTDNHPIEGTDLYNFKARFYDAEIGRFTMTDPIENSNWYIYANNNPLSYIDPTGEANKVLEKGTIEIEGETYNFRHSVDEQEYRHVFVLEGTKIHSTTKKNRETHHMVNRNILWLTYHESSGTLVGVNVNSPNGKAVPMFEALVEKVKGVGPINIIKTTVLGGKQGNLLFAGKTDLLLSSPLAESARRQGLEVFSLEYLDKDGTELGVVARRKGSMKGSIRPGAVGISAGIPILWTLWAWYQAGSLDEMMRQDSHYKIEAAQRIIDAGRRHGGWAAFAESASVCIERDCVNP